MQKAASITGFWTSIHRPSGAWTRSRTSLIAFWPWMVGHTSSHTMHGLAWAHGRHRFRSTYAKPRRIGARPFRPSRSSSVVGRMASVGHTCPHSVQRSSQ